MKTKTIFAMFLLLCLGGCLPQQEGESSDSGGGSGGSSSNSLELPAATPPPVSVNDEPPVVNTDAGPVQAVTELTAPIPDADVVTFRGTSN